ncbi:MAG: hypothetical protein L0Y57_14770 [Beijerinckiaceae bacterium]|nr:hypothetical protein [Beijerinckiaceae bacterium]
MRLFLNTNYIVAAALSTVLAVWAPGFAMSQTPDPMLEASPSDLDPGGAAVAKYIYWTNSLNGTIGRANINGTSPNQRFIPSTTGGAVGGAGVTVKGQFIYWTSANGGTAKTILRAKIDGTGVIKNFITGAFNPCGITGNSTHLYWAGDAGTAIGRANRNGTGVNHNLITTGTGVCGVAVTTTHIYWANYQTSWIGRAKLDGTGVIQHFIPTNGSAFVAIRAPFIYWSNFGPLAGGNSIGRASLNGTGVNQSFITGLNGQVNSLAADSAFIYWANWGNRGTGTTIGRAKLDGTVKNQLFIRGARGPFGIAVTGGNP